ncbi:MAG: hypothetical protein V1858_04470 [Candidatus Gottesmanbacteria bacterium]
MTIENSPSNDIIRENKKRLRTSFIELGYDESLAVVASSGLSSLLGEHLTVEPLRSNIKNCKPETYGCRLKIKYEPNQLGESLIEFYNARYTDHHPEPIIIKYSSNNPDIAKTVLQSPMSSFSTGDFPAPYIKIIAFGSSLEIRQLAKGTFGFITYLYNREEASRAHPIPGVS